MKQPNFLRLDTNSQKLQVDQKFFGSAWSKMGVVNLVSGLKIDCISRITDFLHASTNSRKLKDD